MWSFVIYDLKKNDFLFLEIDLVKNLFIIIIMEKIFSLVQKIKFIHSLINKKNSINKKMITSFLMNGYRNLFKENISFLKKLNF